MPCTTSGSSSIADDPEAGREADVDVGDVLDPHGRALLLGDHDVLDVALRRDLRGARAEKADAAHVVRLLAHGQALPADVLVRRSGWP